MGQDGGKHLQRPEICWRAMDSLLVSRGTGNGARGKDRRKEGMGRGSRGGGSKKCEKKGFSSW